MPRAQYIFHKYLREPAQESLSDERLSTDLEISFDPVDAQRRKEEFNDSEALHDCLEQCLTGLAEDDADFIREYYAGETGLRNSAESQKAMRKRMAERRGISMNALRLRAHRIKKHLEECVDECLNRTK
ncbi:MAG: hypothetical protein L0229_21550 [Blastocatellia bacterium]|nr:hypothetical protein [Blastocatellia bacterium]